MSSKSKSTSVSSSSIVEITKNKNTNTLINSSINSSINSIIEKQQTNNNNNNNNNNESDNDKVCNMVKKQPKNFGNLWTNEERLIVLKYLNDYESDDSSLYNEEAITNIADKLERTEQAIEEEIKKMIYMDYLEGTKYVYIKNKYNMSIANIKTLIKMYLKKNNKKIVNALEIENEILRLQVENLKLRKELFELNSELDI